MTTTIAASTTCTVVAVTTGSAASGTIGYFVFEAYAGRLTELEPNHNAHFQRGQVLGWMYCDLLTATEIDGTSDQTQEEAWDTDLE